MWLEHLVKLSCWLETIQGTIGAAYFSPFIPSGGVHGCMCLCFGSLTTDKRGHRISYRLSADNVSPEVGTVSDGARSTQEKSLPQFWRKTNIKRYWQCVKWLHPVNVAWLCFLSIAQNSNVFVCLCVLNSVIDWQSVQRERCLSPNAIIVKQYIFYLY